MSEPIIFAPTREQIENINVGDLALDCFGKLKRVTRIFARGVSIKGKAFVCFYTESGPTSEISGSYAEGEIVRTVALSCKYTSAQIDQMERDGAGRIDKWTVAEIVG